MYNRMIHNKEIIKVDYEEICICLEGHYTFEWKKDNSKDDIEVYKIVEIKQGNSVEDYLLEGVNAQDRDISIYLSKTKNWEED